jgi:hypothetical protein
MAKSNSDARNDYRLRAGSRLMAASNANRDAGNTAKADAQWAKGSRMVDTARANGR